MRIVWDEPKRLTNLEKHRLDFANLSADWLANLEAKPSRGNRLSVTGELDGKLVMVVFARLGTEAVSIISMHLVGPKRTRN